MPKFIRMLTLSLTGACAFLAATPSWSQTDDLLSRIKSNGQITIGTEARYAPFEYIDEGKIVGYDVDLMNYVLKSLPRVKINQLDLPFQGLLPGLDAKRFDIVVTAVTVNQERLGHFAFTFPVADATTGVLLRAGGPAIKKPEDLNGKTLGTQAGTAQLQAAIALDKKLKQAGGQGFKEIKQYVAFDEAYADLAVGRLDAVAQSLANLGPLLKARPGVFEVMADTIGPKTYFAWVARKDTDSEALVKLFSEGIARANRDGTMKRLQLKWFSRTMDVPAQALTAPAI